MKENFPLTSMYLGRALVLQKLELSEAENDDLKVIPLEAFNFYKEVLSCKNEVQIKNLKCITKAISASKCRHQYNQLIKCTEYLTGKRTPVEDKIVSLCHKEDHNLAYCLEELTFPVLLSLSELPTVT